MVKEAELISIGLCPQAIPWLSNFCLPKKTTQTHIEAHESVLRQKECIQGDSNSRPQRGPELESGALTNSAIDAGAKRHLRFKMQNRRHVGLTIDNVEK